MRVTNKMLSKSFLRDMNTNLKNLQILQSQMTSGKEIQKPSDNPAKVARAMQLSSSINANKQYNDNIKETINFLDTTDTALGQAGDVLKKVRELLVSAGNAAYGSDERKSIKDEINQRIGEFAQILNTSFDGKYIFGGTRGGTKPVITTATAKGDNVLAYNTAIAGSTETNELNKINQKKLVEISPGVTMDYNVSVPEVVEFGGKDIRQIFSNIMSHLESEDDADTQALSDSDLQDITDALNNLLKKRSEVGAKQNRMESAKSKNEDETYNLTSILSKTEDIDITEKTMEYATLQTVYLASLQTSARVLQPTLLDYL